MIKFHGSATSAAMFVRGLDISLVPPLRDHRGLTPTGSTDKEVVQL